MSPPPHLSLYPFTPHPLSFPVPQLLVLFCCPPCPPSCSLPLLSPHRRYLPSSFCPFVLCILSLGFLALLLGATKVASLLESSADLEARRDCKWRKVTLSPNPNTLPCDSASVSPGPGPGTKPRAGHLLVIELRFAATPAQNDEVQQGGGSEFLRASIGDTDSCRCPGVAHSAPVPRSG